MADYAGDPYPSGAGTPDFYGTIRRANEAWKSYYPPDKLTASQGARDAASTSFMNLRSGGGIALPIGYANLAQILASQGKTDPAALNMQLTDISRGTQDQQRNLREQFALAGLGGSTALPALQAATGVGGQVARSRAIASENQLAEDRKRSDLELLYNLIIGPSIQGYGVERGVSVGHAALNQEKKEAMMRFLGTLAVAGACWVAREVYGNFNPKWLEFRYWLLNHAPTDLRSYYLEHGPSIARYIHDKPKWKRAIRRQMDAIIGG